MYDRQVLYTQHIFSVPRPGGWRVRKPKTKERLRHTPKPPMDATSKPSWDGCFVPYASSVIICACFRPIQSIILPVTGFSESL
jgi:hypothetical protein